METVFLQVLSRFKLHHTERAMPTDNGTNSGPHGMNGFGYHMKHITGMPFRIVFYRKDE